MSNFITAIVISLLMAFLYASSKKNPKEDNNGNKVLRLPIFYAMIGLVSTCASLVLLIYGLFNCNPDEVIFVLLVFLLFFGLGIPLLLGSLVSKLTITPNQIEQTTMFGKIKTIKWTEITSISFGRISLELKLKSNNQKIKAHQHLVGFPHLIDMIVTNTEFKREEIGLPNTYD